MTLTNTRLIHDVIAVCQCEYSKSLIYDGDGQRLLCGQCYRFKFAADKRLERLLSWVK